MTLDERIERVAKAIAGNRGLSWIDLNGAQREIHLGYARAALEADAPEIVAAEARGEVDGLVKAGRMISGYRETVPGREPGPLAQIDARIAALQAERNKTT